jgi:hypothetical protein
MVLLPTRWTSLRLDVGSLFFFVSLRLCGELFYIRSNTAMVSMWWVLGNWSTNLKEFSL